jgi:hypothetical protein
MLWGRALTPGIRGNCVLVPEQQRPTASLSADPSTHSTGRWSAAWVPAVLIALGVGLELAYLLLWPVGYRLTHGGQYTYDYLVQFEPLWLKFYDFLQWWDEAFPGVYSSLEVNVNLLLAAFAALFGLYFIAATLAYRARMGQGALVLTLGFAFLFQVTLFFMPGLFTTDMFSYAMYGHISGVYQLNPYIYLPGYFPNNELLDWIHPIWHFAPSVYGPLWTNLSAVLSWYVQDWPLVDRVLAYKALINVVHLVNLGLAWQLLGHLQPKTRQAGLLLFAWNPLLLFEFAGNGHNDALMITFLLLAVLLYLRRLPAWGMLSLVLSMWVKYTTALVAVLYLVIWLRELGSWRKQLGAALLTVSAILAIGLVLYGPWLDGLEIFQPIVEWSNGPMFANHPQEAIARLLLEQGVIQTTYSYAYYPDYALQEALEFPKLITKFLFALYVLYELWRARARGDLVPAAARIFLVFLLGVHTWVLSWYFAWPVALAMLLGLGRPLTHVALGMGYTILVFSYYHQYWNLHMTPERLVLYLLPVLAPLVGVGLRRALSARFVGAGAEPRMDPAGERPHSVLDMRPPAGVEENAA